MMLKPNIKALDIVVSDKKFNIFFIFSFLAYVKHVTPGADHFCLRDIMSTNVVEVYKVTVHTNYQDSWPCCFRQKTFSCFPYISYVKHVTPGAGPFGIIKTNLMGKT